MTVLDSEGVCVVERRLRALPFPDGWVSSVTDEGRIIGRHLVINLSGANATHDVVDFLVQAHERDVRDLLDTVDFLQKQLRASHELNERLEAQVDAWRSR